MEPCGFEKPVDLSRVIKALVQKGDEVTAMALLTEKEGLSYHEARRAIQDAKTTTNFHFGPGPTDGQF